MVIRWLEDIPPEIRLEVYRQLCKSMTIHMHDGGQCDCTRSQQVKKAEVNTMTNLLLSCKSVKAEAEPVFLGNVYLTMASCMEFMAEEAQFRRKSSSSTFTLYWQVDFDSRLSDSMYWVSYRKPQKVTFNYIVYLDDEENRREWSNYEYHQMAMALDLDRALHADCIDEFFLYSKKKHIEIEFKMIADGLTEHPCTVNIRRGRGQGYQVTVKNYGADHVNVIVDRLKGLGLSKKAIKFDKNTRIVITE